MYSVVPGILYISLQRRVQGRDAGKREGLNGKIGVRCVKQKGQREWGMWFEVAYVVVVVCGLWICDLMFAFCILFEF